MRTHAQKQNKPQQQSSHNIRRSSAKPLAASPVVHPILHLQRTIGNQAVQRLFRANAECLEVGSDTSALTRFAHDFSGIPVSGKPPTGILTKLTVNAPGDTYEQEADRVADQVMRAPDAQLQRVCACGGECARCQTGQPGLQRQSLRTKSTPPAHATGETTAPPIVHEALRSSGQPLDSTTATFFEQRFGHDFSHVRVHTDAAAAQSAASLHARAYTVGRDLVFAHGQYAPGTARGRRLLAHELAHVVQQEGSPGANVVQRAEVDDRSCAGLKDIESEIDAHVNKEIADERKAMKSANPGQPIFVPLLLLHVWQRLGQGAISPIEMFIESLPATKRNVPPNTLAGTKYSGVDAVNPFYGLQTGKKSLATEALAKAMGCTSLTGCAHVVGSAAKIHGICVGADKLAHLFDQGFEYFKLASKPGTTTADTENLGRAMETGIFGLGATGVFSNADLAANRAGLQFYKDLEKNPNSFRFKIRNYITDQWNEQVNPNFYDSQVGSVVWSNLLTGPWEGTFTSAASTTPVKAKSNLSATATGSVTGTLELQAQASAGAPKDIKIKNGKITQRTTSVSVAQPSGPPTTVTPVSGISIEFEWERGALSGKGKLDSVNEQTLNGTLGIGSATTGSGTLKLKKV